MACGWGQARTPPSAAYGACHLPFCDCVENGEGHTGPGPPHFLRSTNGEVAAARRLTEGQLRTTLPNKRLGHQFRAGQHFCRRNSHDCDALRGKLRVAGAIPIRAIAHIMGNAVNFDHHLGGRAEEIDDEGADRVLPAKVDPGRVLAQEVPQQDFGQGHFAPQLPRLRNISAAARTWQAAIPPAPGSCRPRRRTSPAGRLRGRAVLRRLRFSSNRGT